MLFLRFASESDGLDRLYGEPPTESDRVSPNCLRFLLSRVLSVERSELYKAARVFLKLHDYDFALVLTFTEEPHKDLSRCLANALSVGLKYEGSSAFCLSGLDWSRRPLGCLTK